MKICGIFYMLFYLRVSSSQSGIPGTLRLRDQGENSTHVWGYVDARVNGSWLRICLQGISDEGYLSQTCGKLGYSTTG